MHDAVADRVGRREGAKCRDALAVQVLFTLGQQRCLPSNAASFSDEEPALIA